MTPRLTKLRELVIQFHGDQKYGEDKPYIYHIDKGCGVLRRFGFKEDEHEVFFEAMLGHDVLEDTSINVWQLLQHGFSQRGTELIFAVTNEEGRNRKERHLKTYAGKIVPTMDAIVIKLADRIANVEEKGKLGMYQKEHADFVSVLRRARTNYPLEVAQMWDNLRTLINPK